MKRDRGGRKRERRIAVREVAPYRYLIVCEGEETEPNYFEGIKKKIDAKYRRKIDVEIDGTGRNTESLVRYALRIKTLSTLPYDKVWVVFDRDDFSPEQFNNAIIKAKDNDLQVAWSNVAIELWFVLHFDYLDSAIGRDQYIEKLHGYFSKHKINNGRYEKNLENTFDVFNEIGNVEEAILRSKKLHQHHEEMGIVTDALKNPCTTVHELVEELLQYI